jgi:hypothetical protein
MIREMTNFLANCLLLPTGCAVRAYCQFPTHGLRATNIHGTWHHFHPNICAVKAMETLDPWKHRESKQKNHTVFYHQAQGTVDVSM